MKVAVGFVLLFCTFVVVIAEVTGSRPLRYNLKKLIRTGRSDPSTEYVLETEKRLHPKNLRTGRSVPDAFNKPEIENIEPLTEDDIPIPYPVYYDFPYYRF